MFQMKEIIEEQDYHPEEIVADVSLTQTWWYGEVQKRRGRVVRRFAVLEDGNTRLLVQFIEYSLIGELNYWYAPYGPVVKDSSQDFLKQFEIAIRSKASASTVFIRLDFTRLPSPAGSANGWQAPSIETNVFTKVSKISGSGSYYQPRYEWYTDISKSDEEILMAMHQKTRYSVRLAEKKGVLTEIVSGGSINTHLPEFIKLMQETAKRNNFTLHDDMYYQAFFDEVARRNNGFLILAKHQGGLLAAHLVVIDGHVAHYVFGGTADTKKDLCAPHLSHFQSMLEAKKRGAIIYNFGGISELGSAPHWESITAFKKRFGGYVHAHGQYLDVVLKPFWYHLYNLRKFIKKFI